MEKLCESLLRPRSRALYPTLWIFVALCFPTTILGIRKEIGFPQDRFCRNTVQGRYLLSDDNGYVCTALSVDPWTRCCPEMGDRFSCQGCNLVSQCCDSYEYCVSCCLNPSKTKMDLAVKVKIAKPVTAGRYGTVFDFCAGRCRHNSASVVHENAYASDFHHCFSLQLNSSGLIETNSEAQLTSIDVVVGRLGESCNSVCMSKGQSCVPNRLFVLNRCELLRKYMSCKSGCYASTGADQPAEVADDAPNHMNPGACLYTQMEDVLTCDGSHQRTRRLCPCA
ncbi:uncharacterized protein LOC109723507 [Ananas comosus]|uniref:SREBP regulating gene protein n=1 Tax=Ananas comosus TaxID=4615 RepID=A0A6P5GHS2_ANACO|nr:uncharacterized protein LOC109723507 [Ananas comosus]